MLKKLLNFLQKNTQLITILTVLVFSGFMHAYNMLQFPFFENDEGTYMAQAWSFLTEGKLAPYTYWYDHAPAGWIFISVWIFITNGLFTFGYSLNSGRIFMLVLHLFSTFFLYMITKKVSKSDFAASLTGFFFAVSPLAIYFQRRLLLDNLMVFWLLLSIYLIIVPKKKLSYIFVSAISFAISVLTKENAVFYMPVIMFLIYDQMHNHNRIFAVLKWTLLSGGIIAIYPLYAFLKKELFPPNTLFAVGYDHVSLIGTLKSQASRGTDLPFWENGSDFLLNLDYWFIQDPLLIFFGFTSFIISGLLAFFSKQSRIAFILTLPIVLFLISGKLVINFYVIPLIPFLSMCLAISILHLYNILAKVNRVFSFIIIAILLTNVLRYYYIETQGVLAIDETSKQKQAVNWIKDNIDKDSFISIDFYSYLDLSESRFEGDPEFKNADWFWKVELDPDIKIDKLNQDPENLDYVMVTAEVQRQLKGFPESSSMLRGFLKDSIKIKEFASEDDFKFKLDLYSQNYPNGDWVVLYKKSDPPDKLTASWNYYKRRFIIDHQYTIDPSNGFTTSEGQSYALLRAVWINDQETFDSVWNWTKINMANPEGTFAWKYAEGEIKDKGTATDGDVDIALALIFASKKWDEDDYLDDARHLLNGIWKTEVKKFNGKNYILPGNWARDKETLISNPSYYAPYAYKIFAEVDPNHDWGEIVETSYEVLENCMKADFDGKKSVNLPPNWCAYNRNGVAVIPQESGLQSTDYSYDAIRTMWRLALDYKWNNDPRALRLLELSGEFLNKKWDEDGKIVVGYSHDGEEKENYEAILGYSTNLANFVITNPEIADYIYEHKLDASIREKSENGLHYWEDPDNYYTQNWAWFGTALYSNNLPNLWEE